MKYPDISVVRFFFKNGLADYPSSNPKVIEFGCGSGHNLRIFEDFGWECHGVDLESSADFIEDACLGTWKVPTRFYAQDLNTPLDEHILVQEYDVVLFPSVTYYLEPSSRINLLRSMFKCLKPGGYILLIERLTSDYRYGKGRPIGANGFQLDISETGELGLTIQFFSKEEILSTVKLISNSNVKNIVALESTYDNLQEGVIVRNSECVVWAQKCI
jgi:SAM-dependent methyltransferase